MKKTTPPLPYLAARVAEGRAARSLTVYALAKTSGVDASYIYRIESGRTEPGFRTMCRLAAALGRPLEYFADPAEMAT